MIKWSTESLLTINNSHQWCTRLWNVASTVGITVSVGLLVPWESLSRTCDGIHNHVAAVIKGEVCVALVRQRIVGGIDLIRGVGVGRLCRINRNWGEGCRWGGRDATHCRALTVTVLPGKRTRNGLVYWTSIVDWIGHHGAKMLWTPICWRTPTWRVQNFML